MDSWFLSAVRGSSGNERMVSEDPVRRLCLGRLRNLPAIITCILVTGLQAFLLNIHLVGAHEDRRQWIWFIGDGLTISLFIATFYMREWRIGHLTSRHKEETGFVKGLPLAAVAWVLYGSLIAARVAIVFKFDLENHEEIGDLKLIICLSAIVCVFFTVGHHHNHESLARRAAIIGLIKNFTIDLLDTVDILEVLFETEDDHEGFSVHLENYILFIVALNLIRPAIVLTSLFVDHFATVKKSLMTKIIKSILELAFLNMPLLGTRVYIAAQYADQSVSVFLVKNLLGIIFGIVEVYDCSYEYHEFCKGKGDFVDISPQAEVKENHDITGSSDDTDTELHQTHANSNGNGDAKKLNGIESNDVTLNDSSSNQDRTEGSF